MKSMPRFPLPVQKENQSGGNNMYYAVIDTNVLVSALLSASFFKSAPGKIVSHIITGEIIPVYNEEILTEYYDVLKRDKFHFSTDRL